MNLVLLVVVVCLLFVVVVVVALVYSPSPPFGNPPRRGLHRSVNYTLAPYNELRNSD